MTKNKLITITLNAITPTFGMMILVTNMLDAHDNEGIFIRLLSKFLFSLAISVVIASLVLETNTLKEELGKVRDELKKLKEDKQGASETDTRD